MCGAQDSCGPWSLEAKNWDGLTFLAQTAVWDDLMQEAMTRRFKKLPQISVYAIPDLSSAFLFSLT